MTYNVALFAVAALFELAGCFAFWACLRRVVTPFVLVLGMGSLMALRWNSRESIQCSPKVVRRIWGIYIVASLVWLWIVEHQTPTQTDLLGAELAVEGAGDCRFRHPSSLTRTVLRRTRVTAIWRVHEDGYTVLLLAP